VVALAWKKKKKHDKNDRNDRNDKLTLGRLHLLYLMTT
jgi:hypothetical protein